MATPDGTPEPRLGNSGGEGAGRYTQWPSGDGLIDLRYAGSVERRRWPRVGSPSAATDWSAPPPPPTAQTFTVDVQGAPGYLPPPVPDYFEPQPQRPTAYPDTFSDAERPRDEFTFADPAGYQPLSEPAPTYASNDFADSVSYQPVSEPAPSYANNDVVTSMGFEFPRTIMGPPPLPEARWDIPPLITGAERGADALTADRIIRSRRATPGTGWRKMAYTLSRGLVNPGPSPAERKRAHLLALARTHTTWCHRLAVISLKGGVGKTTTTAALGAMLAELRGDRVIAVDANPDRGTLGERVPRESGATVRHLLQARHQIHGYADVRTFTSQAASRLEVLASDSDPGASLAYSEQDYRDTVATLDRFYNLLLTDCGTGLLHSAMAGILHLADSLIVVSSPSLDGARSASATLDWLEAHGFGELAADAIVVISSVRPGSGMVDVELLVDHFAARCREVVLIPYDPHLEVGGIIDLDLLKPATRQAYLELAAVVGQGLAG